MRVLFFLFSGTERITFRFDFPSIRFPHRKRCTCQIMTSYPHCAGMSDYSVKPWHHTLSAAVWPPTAPSKRRHTNKCTNTCTITRTNTNGKKRSCLHVHIWYNRFYFVKHGQVLLRICGDDDDVDGDDGEEDREDSLNSLNSNERVGGSSVTRRAPQGRTRGEGSVLTASSLSAHDITSGQKREADSSRDQARAGSAAGSESEGGVVSPPPPDRLAEGFVSKEAVFRGVSRQMRVGTPTSAAAAAEVS